MPEAPPAIALYVHWPFCLSKCPYCDFNSHVRETVDHGRWRRALLAELAHVARLAGPRRLTSIFFGGGTPSLMEAETVGAVIDAAAVRWSADPEIEITLEANPTSVEAGRFEGYRAAGVNRVSLGVQALCDADLKALGRQHSAAEALAVVELARRVFDNLSFDLIYARPGQTVAAWRAELDRALDRAADHLSLYQLTVEPGTAFESLYRQGRLAIPDEDRQAALYETTQEVLSDAGLPAYEISNHARPGRESRHNLTYWRYGDYAGIGPGAHGRLTLDGRHVATRTHRAPEVWLSRVEAAGHGGHGEETIDQEAAAGEALMMGLRLAEGIDEARWRAAIGAPLSAFIDPAQSARLAAAGLIGRDDERLWATVAGRQRLNALLGALMCDPTMRTPAMRTPAPLGDTVPRKPQKPAPARVAGG